MTTSFSFSRSSLVLLATSASLLALPGQPPSSHREAPFVTEHPKVDATDFYMFTSYETGRADYVTLIANYLPLQDAYGGPNYFTLDPEAAYDIHVDNNADAVEDLTFRFHFRSVLKDITLDIGPPGNTKKVSVPLRNVGPIGGGSTDALNEVEVYTVELISGPVDMSSNSSPVVNAATGAAQFVKPVDNIGNKSIPNYESYAAARTYDIKLPDGSLGRMFVGQRKDPFVVNLGEVFDLVNTNPLGPVNGEKDDLADANITSLILEIPKSFLQPNGSRGGPRIIGAWTAARLPEGPSPTTPTFELPSGSPYFDRFRASMPLVNEVAIGLKDKNLFNASYPINDWQFLDYVTNPTLPALLEALFGVRAPTKFPRTDLIQVFLTGIPGLNANGSTAEMMRLNLDVPPVPAAQQSNLGALGGDIAGYPNGRRPGDDVVDMSLRVVMGVLLNTTDAPDGQLPYTDGAFLDASFFDETFPYLRTPLPGSPSSN
jgi:hypothetical protein